jgi:phosphoenolpyruvate carboxykinase (GTP)
LVVESKDWETGVYWAATIGSETTAAAAGAVGQVRRDPFAMLPFCGYHMGDYFQHWLDLGKKVTQAPKIFGVNWFRKGADGKFMWPGYGDNMRVLEWIIGRVRGSAGGIETEIGTVPAYRDLNWAGLSMSETQFNAVSKIDREEWIQELDLQSELLKQLNSRIPSHFPQIHSALQERFRSKQRPSLTL